MPIDTLFTFLAIAISEKVTTSGDFILLISVEIIALVALFAVAFKIMNTNNLFVLAFVCL
jgi:hypothetical protein